MLAGDPVFDNAGYALGEPGVIAYLRRLLPGTCFASLVAVDGYDMRPVTGQIANPPLTAAALDVSCGGHDCIHTLRFWPGSKAPEM